jgi:hypothetical protein
LPGEDAAHLAIEACLCVVTEMMRMHGARSGTHHHGVGIGGIDGNTPQIAIGKAIVGLVPGIATVGAFEVPVTRGAVQSIRGERMHHDGMRVEGAAGAAILPRVAAIQAAEERTGLGGDKDAAGHKRIRSYPADQAGVGARRKAPRRRGRYLEEVDELSPRLTTVVGAEQGTWFCPGVDHAVLTHALRRAHGDGHDLGMGDAGPVRGFHGLAGVADWLPGIATIVAAPQATPERAAIDALGPKRVDG